MDNNTLQDYQNRRKFSSDIEQRKIFPTNHPFVNNEDGTQSNVVTSTVGFGDRTFVIPTMVDGKQLDIDEAISTARSHGLDKYPSFSSEEDANTFSQNIHDKIDERGFTTKKFELEQDYAKRRDYSFELETKYDHKAIHDHIASIDTDKEMSEDEAERMIKLYYASQLNMKSGDQRTPDEHDYLALVHSVHGENATKMKKSDVFKTMQKMIVPEKDAEADKYISYRDMDFEQKWEEARPDDSYDRPAQNVSAFGVKVGDDVKATEYSKEEQELIVAQYENQLRLKSPFLTKLMGKQILSPRMQKLAFDLANGVQRESMAFEFSSKMEQDLFPHYLRTLNPEIDVTGIGGTISAVWGRSLQTEADGRESRYMSLYRGDVFDDDLVLNLKLKEKDILGGYDFANGKWYGDVAKEKAQEYMDNRWLMKRDESPSFQRHGTFEDDKIDVDSPEFHERMQKGNQDYNNKKWSRLIDKATRDVYDYGKGVSGVAKTAIGEGTAMLTYMIPVMAGGIVGGAGGSMFMSGSEFYGRHMDDLIYDHGVDISRAQLNALMTAIPYSMSEHMQVGKLKQLMKAGKVSKKNADIAGDMFKKFPKFVEDKFIPLFKELAPAYFYENSQEFAQGVIERAGRMFAKEYQEAEGITFDGEMESLMEEMKMSAQATLLPVIGARMMRGADMKGGAFGNEQEARNIAEKYADLNVMSQEEANDIKKQLTPDLKVAYNEAQTFEEKQEVLDDAGLNLKVEQVEQFDNRERIVEELADQATTDIKKQFDISEQEAQSIIEDDLDTFVQSRAKMVKYAKTVDPYADLIQTGKDTATIKGKNGAELQLNLVDSMKQEGAWSPKDKTITLPRNAEDFTFTHEITHAMRDLGLISDKEWKQVVEYGKKQFKSDKVKTQFQSVDQLKQTYIDGINEAGRKNAKETGTEYKDITELSDDVLQHEIVANTLEDWRRNGAPEDASGAFQKVLDFFKNLIGKASDFQVAKDIYEGKPLDKKVTTTPDTDSPSTESGTPDPREVEPNKVINPDAPKVPWRARMSIAPEVDLESMPIIDETNIEQILGGVDKMGLIHIDRMRVGEAHGVPLQGGILFPAIRENVKKAIAWAFNSEGTARDVLNRARKNNGYLALVAMQEGNVVGNKTFTNVWFNALQAQIDSKKISKTKALKMINEIRKTYSKSTGHSKNFKTLDEAKQAILSIAQQKRGQTYMQKTKAKTKARGEHIRYGAMLKGDYTSQGFPSAEQLVEEVEQPELRGVKQGDIIGIIKVDPDSKIMTAEEAGVTEHMSYGYVVNGEPVGRISNPANIDDVLPELKNLLASQGQASLDTKDVARFSLAPPTDSKAFKDWFGDSKMVDKDGNPIVFYHGSRDDFNEFKESTIGSANDAGFYGRGFYFTFGGDWSKGEAKYYGDNVKEVYLKIEKPFDFSTLTSYEGVSSNYMSMSPMIFLLKIADEFPSLANSIYATKKTYDNDQIVEKKVPIKELKRMIEDAKKDIEFFEGEDMRGNEITLAFTKPYEVTAVNWEGVEETYEREDEIGKFKKDLSKEELELLSAISYLDTKLGISADFQEEGYMTRNPQITEAIKAKGHDGIIQSWGGDEAVVFSPTQIKSATDNVGTYDPSNADIRYSVAPPVESDAFDDMYKDAYLKNEDGSPIPMYHKTWSEFDEFEYGGVDKTVQGWEHKGQKISVIGKSGRAFFFSPDPSKTPAEHNRMDQGERTIKAYINIEAPLVIDDDKRFFDDELLSEIGHEYSEFPYVITDQARENLKSRGYDSIILKHGDYDFDSVSDFDELIVLDKDNIYQVKEDQTRYAMKPLANAEVLASTYIASKQAEGKPLTDAEIEDVMEAFDIKDSSNVLENVSKIVDDEDDAIKKATHTSTMRKAIATKANKLAYQDRIRGIATDAKKGGAIYQQAEDRLRKQLKAKKLAELAGNKLSDEKTAEITESLRQVIDQGEDTKPVLKQIESAVREEMISKGEFTKRKMAYKKDPAYRIALGNTLTEIANNLVRDLPHSRRKDSLSKIARNLKNYTSVKYMENNFDKFLDKRKKAMIVEDKKTLLKKWNKLMNSSAVKEKDKSTQEIIRSKFVKDEDGNIVAKSLHPKDRRRIQLIKQVAKLGTKAKKGDLSKLDTVISALKAYIDRASVESNEAKAELKAIELMIPAIKNFNHLDPQDRAQLALAEVVRFGGIREKSEIEIADALDAIEEDIASSFSLVEDLINDKNKRVDPMRDAIAETAGERSGKKRQKFDEYLGMAYDMRSWFDAIISKAPEGKRAEAKKHLDGLLRDWNHAIQTRDLEINKSHNEYFNAVEKIYNDEAWKITQRLEQKVDAYRKFSKLNDPMSKAQVMQLYASAVQQDYIDNAIENDRTAGQYLEVLTKEDLALIQWYRDYYADQRPSLSTKLEELTGIPINMQDPFYVPVKMKMPEADLPTEIIITKIIPDGMIQRIQHTRDFDETVSINQMWMKKVSENEHFKNVSDIAMDFRSVFSSGRVHDAIANTYGTGFKNDFMEMIQDNINDGYSGDKKIDWLDKLRGAWTASKFGFNARIGIKQLTSIPAFGFEIGLMNVGTYTASAWTPEGRKAMLEILKSDLAKDRLGKGSTEAIMNSLNESIITTDKINLQKWTKRMMVFNEWGDIVPSMIIGQGIYRSYTEHHSKTMDKAKAKETALKDLFQIIESTQQSSKLKDWSAFQRRYGSLGRMMSQFTNTTRQFLVRDFTDIRNYIDNRSSDNLKKMSSTLFINHALLPALYNGMNMIINKLMGDDIDEDDWWLMGLSMLTGPLSGYVVAGTILVGMTQGIVTGEKPWGGTSLTPFAGIKDDVISSGQIAHGILTADTEEFIRGLDDLLQSLVAPYREGKKIKKNYLD